jgi:hypothetical protein
MGGQSVVIWAEKGKLSMLVDGESASSQKELVYDARKDIDHEHDPYQTPGIRAAEEDNRGALALERAANQRAALSGDGHQPGPSWPVAESGDRGDAPGAGPQKEGPAAADQSATLTSNREEACWPEWQDREALAGDPEGQGGDDWTVPSETSRQRRVEMYHVRWLRPNLAWAMDDCAKNEDGAHDTLHLHNPTDLHSRYRLPPLAADRLPCGEEVAGHLQYLFERFDPPLFCKRDNGGNLNNLAVNQVLEEALVISINSPPYRAPHHGGIEHTQGEFKSYLDRWSWKTGTVDKMALLSETAAHDLNHQPRRCLGGKSACHAYFGGPRIRYPRRKRAAVYSWINDLVAELSTRGEKSVIPPVAWRVAARQWLIKNGLIGIQKTGEVSPNFLKKSDHN